MHFKLVCVHYVFFFFIVLKPDCSYIIPTSTKYPFNWGVSNSAAGFLHCCLCQFKTKIAQPWSPPSPCHAFPSSQPSSSAFPLNPPLCLPVPSFNEGIGVLAVIGLITATCYRWLQIIRIIFNIIFFNYMSFIKFCLIFFDIWKS